MQGIKQRLDHLKKNRFYQEVNQVPFQEKISERKLKMASHCISTPTDEPSTALSYTNRKLYLLFNQELKKNSSCIRSTYRQQIFSHLLPDEKTLEAKDIRKMSIRKSTWNKHFVVFKKKKPPGLSSEIEW